MGRSATRARAEAPPGDAWVECAPAAALRPWVERYIGYRLVGRAPGLHRGLPSRHMTFIVSIGSPIDVVAQTNASQCPRVYRAVVGGLQAAAALVAHDGNEEGIAIELTPLGSRALFAVPARELWDLSLELGEVRGRASEELWERLQRVRPTMSWRERFDVCDEVLGAFVRPDVSVAIELEAAWNMLVRSGGQIPIETLSARIGWTRQHLRRRFQDELGLSPKLAGRIIRFERARRMIQAGDRGSLAGVAAACGYFDQAHLHRDVVALAGCAPSDLVEVGESPSPRAQEEDVPFVQDGTGARRSSSRT